MNDKILYLCIFCLNHESCFFMGRLPQAKKLLIKLNKFNIMIFYIEIVCTNWIFGKSFLVVQDLNKDLGFK